MKPKTFTYNQIIKFFNDHNMPLKPNQVALIGLKVREEFEKLSEYREHRREKIRKIKVANFEKRERRAEKKLRKAENAPEKN